MRTIPFMSLLGSAAGHGFQYAVRVAATGALSCALLLSGTALWGGGARAQQMAVAGKLEVTQQGAATYTIPIAVPPGTVGMAPTLMLAYNSQQGDGPLGVGWSLGGLPTITRCPQTLVQDGVRGAVNYAAADRFCLEGQRLMAVSGTYGADGTEYRTELEGFSKVVSKGTAGSGPAWFEVRTKAGQVMEFGHTADSQILVQGSTTARAWQINKIADVKGNYLTVSYTVDAANGQAYPNRIDYTGNAAAGLAPYNSVRLVYEARPDAAPLYHAGALIKTSQRLTAIEAYAGATRVNRYQLAYESSPTTQRSRLKSVTQCAASGACLPATGFTYLATNDSLTIKNNIAGQDAYIAVGSAGWVAQIGDFNGDGKADLYWDHQNESRHSTGYRKLWLNTGDGAFQIIDNLAGQDASYIPGVNAGWVSQIGDFNGDGRADLYWDYQDQYGHSIGFRKIWMGTGDGTFQIINNLAGQDANIAVGSAGWVAQIGDFNGDGKADLYWDHQNEYRHSTGYRKVWLGNGDGTFQIIDNLAGQDANYIPGVNVGWVAQIGDFNGDGKADLYWDYQDQYHHSIGARKVWLGNGDGTFRIIDNLAGQDGNYIPGGSSGWIAQIGDFNGDGKADLYWDYQDQYGHSVGFRKIWLGKGDGTFQIINNLAGQDAYIAVGSAGWVAQIGDFNGDGKADLYWDHQNEYNHSTGYRKVWLGNGDGTFQIIDNLAGQDANYIPGGTAGWVAQIGDFNGDGKADLYWDYQDQYHHSTGFRKTWVSDNKIPDVVTGITTGLGAITSILYKPLTDGSVYAKGSGASYPVQDLQPATYVVAQTEATDGIGGSYKIAYSYAGARADFNGRGFLGFSAMSVRDLQTNLLETSNYRQDYPYIGLTSSKSKTLNGLALNQESTTYAATALGGTRYFVAPAQVTVASKDLSGTAVPTVTTTYQYDGFGNPTQVVVSTPDGASKTTTNTYSNDAASWLLGRLTAASVTSVVP